MGGNGGFVAALLRQERGRQMSEPREAITYQFPVTVTVVLDDWRDPPTESQVQAAMVYQLGGLTVEVEDGNYGAEANVGAAESRSEGLVP